MEVDLASKVIPADTYANKCYGNNIAVDQLARVGYPQNPVRKMNADENEIFNDTIGDTGVKQEVGNEKALHVYNRVQHKLTGRDFDPNVVLSVEDQVDRLIQEATSLENLCQCFSGWCAFW